MDETNSLIEQRKAKLAAPRAKGIDLIKNNFTPGETCAAARANYAERERLEHQAGGEQQKLDEAFLIAFEQGMPPAEGMGMVIDRLWTMLFGQEGIRDVILFPQFKPK